MNKCAYCGQTIEQDVIGFCSKKCESIYLQLIQDNFDENIDYENDDDGIFGYECLCCGTSWDTEDCDEGDECPACGAMALSALYF